MQPNIYFEHIRRLQQTAAEAKDIQSVLNALDRLKNAHAVWSDISFHVKEHLQEAADPNIIQEVLNDIEALIAFLEHAQHELSGWSVVKPAVKKSEAVVTPLPEPAEKAGKKKGKGAKDEPASEEPAT